MKKVVKANPKNPRSPEYVYRDGELVKRFVYNNFEERWEPQVKVGNNWLPL